MSYMEVLEHVGKLRARLTQTEQELEKAKQYAVECEQRVTDALKREHNALTREEKLLDDIRLFHAGLQQILDSYENLVKCVLKHEPSILRSEEEPMKQAFAKFAQVLRSIEKPAEEKHIAVVTETPLPVFHE